MTSLPEREDYPKALEKALEIARSQNFSVGTLSRVEDAWGGYWQCKTESGCYNFRTIYDTP